MIDQKVTRLDVIGRALANVYSSTGKIRGTMIEGLAEAIDKAWDQWEAGEGEARYHGTEYAAHMMIWNWFPGGGTAEIAAQRVMAAVTERGSVGNA